MTDRDEIKFVISDRAEFDEALSVVESAVRRGQILFSPEWNSLPPTGWSPGCSSSRGGTSG